MLQHHSWHQLLATAEPNDTHAGQLSPLALPQETNQPAAQAPVQKAAQAEAAAMPKEDWATACFSSLKDTTSHYSLPVSSWQLPTSGEGTPFCQLQCASKCMCSTCAHACITTRSVAVCLTA